jgi:hypothetical protein
MDLLEIAAREQVRDVIAEYCHAVDVPSLSRIVALFTDDGVLEIEGWSTGRTRQGIIDMFKSWRPAAPVSGAAAGLRLSRHLVGSIRFHEVRPDVVRTTSYFVRLGTEGLAQWGRYNDVFRPVDGAWLIEHRIATVDAAVPGDPYHRPPQS